MTCEEFGEHVGDLALGQVAEPERGALLGHAAACAACGALLADLSAVGDRLLHLAPDADPAVGFEARAVAAMVAAPAGRGRRRGAAWLPAAAVAAVALVVGLLVGGLVFGGDGADAGVVAAPIVMDDGERIGTAELDAAAPRIVLTMDGPSTWEGTWTCEVRVAGGEWTAVGTWTADDVTNHVWAAGLDDELAGAEAMRILGDGGGVVGVASFGDAPRR